MIVFLYFQVNWTEAVRQCRLRNMELISILSKEQNDKIIKTIRDARKYYRICSMLFAKYFLFKNQIKKVLDFGLQVQEKRQTTPSFG